MSRIGKRPIKYDSDVSITQSDDKIVVSCAENKIEVKKIDGIKVIDKKGLLHVVRDNDQKSTRSYHGLIARLLSNAVYDVKNGKKINITIVGTGYRAKVEDGKLILNIGYSHEVCMDIPIGIKVEVKKNDISIEGHDRWLVGKFASELRSQRKPEVYKGKGLKYKDEMIKKKAGKTAQTASS